MVLRDTDLERLRSLPLFGDASAETFKLLMGGALLQRFSAGALLLIEGDAVDFLYVLLDGSVALAGTWNDKETTLSVLEPVSTFVLDAVVLDTESLVSATTLERSEVLMISGDSLRATMRSDASFGFSVSQELAGGHRSLVRSIKNHKLRGGAERLANHLLVLRARHGGSNILTLPYEKRVLASLMGMSPENLSRAFATLTGYGVEVRGPMVEIKRPAALERLARPTPLIDNHLPVHEGAMGDAQRELLAPVAA